MSHDVVSGASVIIRYLRVNEDIWRGLVDAGGKGPTCACCGAGMRTFNLKGVVVDGCACGALLLDPGELQRLTGRDEGPAPSAPASLDGLGRVHAPAGETLARFLGAAPWVQLKQERPSAVGALIVDFGTRFAVSTPQGSGLLVRQEGGAQFLARMFLAGLVRQRFTLHDPRDAPMLVLERSFKNLVLSRLDVHHDEAGDPGLLLGTVERSLAIVETRYELKDERGRLFARLVRPLTSLWQFRLETANGDKSGAVAKQWSGFRTEFFNDADDYGVDFGDYSWTTAQRAIIVAAALAIDLDHFERGPRTRGRSLLDMID